MLHQMKNLRRSGAVRSASRAATAPLASSSRQASSFVCSPVVANTTAPPSSATSSSSSSTARTSRRNFASMRTLAKVHAEEGIWMNEVPIPKPGYNDVLIKIKKTAICGTDVSIYKWTPWAQNAVPVGLTVGHEYSGEIVEMGEGAAQKGLKIGTRVSGEGHLVCGMCRNCRAGRRHLCRKTEGIGVNMPGAFAEYLALPAENVFILPDSISDDVASILDPLGNAVHTAFAFDLVGEDVLVTGAGPIGIMGAMLAKRAGARRVAITDVNDYRLELARKMPQIDRVVNVAKEDLSEVAFDEMGLKEGFDVGLEMSGNEHAFVNMIHTMNNGGKIALLGLVPDSAQIPWSDVIFKGLEIKGIYGREMYETWYKMMAVLDSGFDVSPIITHHYAIKDYQTAFEKAVSSSSGKVILNWQDL
ncbi:unnamed protein product [Amoebophrya sp. A120]|nr:unnamed protein product [Amoebophrya sp. A120]|eukprot:GSA120T00018800001.1